VNFADVSPAIAAIDHDGFRLVFGVFAIPGKDLGWFYVGLVVYQESRSKYGG
jgi:hypothetical protein